MQLQIDQSQKIEQTSKDTVIGLTNSKTFSILIPRKIKRRLQEEFRKKGEPRLFVYRTFIAGVVLLLYHSKLDLKENDVVVIDIEYFGKDQILASMFLEMYSRIFTKLPQIEFRTIGRKSKAHTVSYMTAKGKQKANKMLTYGELKDLALK